MSHVSRLASHVSRLTSQDYLYIAYATVLLIGVVLGLVTGIYPLMALPLGLLVVYVAVVDFRKIFYLLIACIPFSTEIHIPGAFSVNLPSEPLIIGLTLVCVFYLLGSLNKINGRFFRHPLMLVLLLHLGWMFIATLNSELFLVSVKFFIAKTWYIFVFVILTGILIKSKKDFRELFWCFFIPLLITICIVVIRQSGSGFSLKDSHRAMQPFYHNHVVYAALLSLFLPYVIVAQGWYKRWSRTWWMVIFGGAIILIGIQLSYTRTAYVALMMGVGAYVVIRLRLVKFAVGLGLVAVLAGVIYLSHDNKYLDYAPNYETTISHYDFNSLLEATYKMEDISTMERVYRWVAAVQMSKEELLTGFGPGNFQNFYQQYTVSSFETYVSDNPERSGIHNYYLMMLTDQGIPGLIIFLILTVVILVKGENIYHKASSPTRRHVIIAALVSLVIIDAFLIINDLIETDKVGSFFFMNIALLINCDVEEF